MDIVFTFSRDGEKVGEDDLMYGKRVELNLLGEWFPGTHLRGEIQQNILTILSILGALNSGMINSNADTVRIEFR